MSCDHQESSTPNSRGSCIRCGRTIPQPRPRNIALERELVQLVAEGAGFTSDGGLSQFADRRAHPGGLRPEVDWESELREELADARSYACWMAEEVWDAHLNGDGDASAVVERALRCLQYVVIAWHELHREAT